MHSIKVKTAQYLKYIIELYIKTGQPVGSKNLKKFYNLDHAPSSIRNAMLFLEKEGFLEKSHASSGRIPTLKGYEYYAKFLANDTNNDLQQKLEDIFAKRRTSIDETVSEAVKIISDIANITLVTTTNNTNEKLMSIHLTIISDSSGVVVLVTSSGKVENKVIHFNETISKNDVQIAIRIFKERLLGISISQIATTLQILSPILSQEIKNTDGLLKHFVENIFNFQMQHTSQIYNKNSLILNKDISRQKLIDILEIIEKNSIWEFLEKLHPEDKQETLKINIESQETSFILKKFPQSSNLKELSIVGSTKKMNYSAILTGIKLLEDFLNNKDTKLLNSKESKDKQKEPKIQKV